MIQIYLLFHYLQKGIAKELNWCIFQNDQCLPIEEIKQVYQYNQITFTSIFDLEQNQTILFQGLTNEFQIIIDNSTDFNFTQTMNGLLYIHNNITINISIVHQISIDPGMDFKTLLFQLINKLNKSIKIQDKKIKVVDCHIKAKKIDNQIAILDVKFEYSEFIEYNIRLKLKFKGIIIYFQDFDPQKKFIYQTEIAIENPQFWWPIRYGEQNLYDLEIYHQLESWELVYSHQYGIRSITLSYDYEIRINQIEIITKEVRIDVQKPYHHLTNGMIIQNAISLGFNLIRIQEQFVDKEFFQLADQHGIMVILILWDEQDITINNKGQQLINTIIRFKNHCSLVSYGGMLEWQLGDSKQSYYHNNITLNKISQYIDQYSQCSYIILYNPPVNEEYDAYDYTTLKVHYQQYKLNQDNFDNLKSSFKLTYNKFDQAYYINCVQYEYYSNVIWINKLHQQNISQQQTLPSLNNLIDYNNCKLAGAYAIKNNQQIISIGYKFEKNLLIIQIIQEFFIISNVTLSIQLRFFVNNTIWHKQNNSLFINRYIISDVQIVKINKEQLKHSYLITKLQYNNHIIVRFFTLEKPNQLKLQKPKIQIDFQGNKLRLVSDTYTKYVYIYHKCVCLNPSDNYFDLLPNQEKFVELENKVQLSEIEIKYLII